jgi:hypothetical protein
MAIVEQAIEQFRPSKTDGRRQHPFARPELGKKNAPHALSGMEREVRGCET